MTLPTSLESASDAILAQRSADGDVSAFEVLVRRYAPRMRAYAVMILGSTYESDDVVQESLITAWGKISELLDGEAVKSWLMRIVSRKCIDRVRVRRHHIDVAEIDAAAHSSYEPENHQESKNAREALRYALDALPDLQRRCWILREVGQYSYHEIADELDLPISMVRKQLTHGRRRLLEAMEGWR